MAPLTSCPPHQILSNGGCVCELGYSAWKKGENSIECSECLKCDPSKCLARNTECNNKIPFNKTVIQECVQPTEEHFSHPESGDLTPCRPPCSENEREIQKCSCSLDRKCKCQTGFNRGGPEGDCSNRHIDKMPKTTLESVKTTFTNVSATVGNDSVSLTTTTPSTVNVTTQGTSNTSIQPIVQPTGTPSPFVIAASIVLLVAIASVIIYAWKKLKIRETNNNDSYEIDDTNTVPSPVNATLLGSDNEVIFESEDGEEEVTVSNEEDELLDEIEEKILQCHCQHWSLPFCKHVGEVLDVQCNENLHKFFYNVFDQQYIAQKRIYIKSFKDVIAHLRSYKPDTFTTKDLILELNRLRGCKDAVKNICDFIRNNHDYLIIAFPPG